MLYRIVILVVLLTVFLLPGEDPFAANVQEAPEFATVEIDRIAVFAEPDELSAFMEAQNVSQRFAVTMARVLEEDRGYQTDYVKPNKRHWVPAIEDIVESDLIWADEWEDEGRRFVLVTSLTGYEFTQSEATLNLHAKLLDTLARRVLWNGEMTFEGNPAIQIEGLVKLAAMELALSMPHDTMRSLPDSALSNRVSPVDVLSPAPVVKETAKSVPSVRVVVENLPFPTNNITPLPPPFQQIEIIREVPDAPENPVRPTYQPAYVSHAQPAVRTYTLTHLLHP